MEFGEKQLRESSDNFTYEQFYEAYWGYTLKTVKEILEIKDDNRLDADAEEIAHNIFEKIRNEYFIQTDTNTIENPERFLYITAINEALNFKKFTEVRDKRQAAFVESAPEGLLQPMEEGVAHNEGERQIMEENIIQVMLDAVPEKYKKVFYNIWVNGDTYKEAANDYTNDISHDKRVSEKTLQNIASKARKVLREQKSSKKAEKINYKDIFSYPIIDHPILEQYGPEYLGRGGFHAVYEIENHPNIVAKLEHAFLKRATDFNIKSKGVPTPDKLDERLIENFRRYRDKMYKRQRDLTEHFGKEHTVPFKLFLAKVPVTEKMLAHVWQDSTSEAPKVNELWSSIMIQKRIKPLAQEKRSIISTTLSLAHGYPERKEKPPSKEIYDKVTNKLVFFPNNENVEMIPDKLFFDLQGSRHLYDLIKKAKKDKELEKAIKDFIQKSIQYTKTKNEILDIAPSDNAIFFKEKYKWSYKMPDALSPNSRIVPDALNAIHFLQNNNSEISSKRANLSSLYVFFNYVRTINKLADVFGIDERLDLIPEQYKKQDISYYTPLMEYIKKRHKK